VAWWEAALAVVVILALLLGATLWEAARRGV
jgi:predicted small integral membrane protein